jgi:general stress protein 26
MTTSFTSSADAPQAVSRLVALLRDFEAATLVTRTRAGSLHGRPMSIAHVEDNVTIWFVTSAASAKAEELSDDARAMLTLQSPTRFVSVNGRAELVFDATRIEALWKEWYRVWGEGATAPQIALVRFTPFEAEYWDNSGMSELKYVFRAARAYVTGHAAELEADSVAHARLRFWEPEGASPS